MGYNYVELMEGQSNMVDGGNRSLNETVHSVVKYLLNTFGKKFQKVYELLY